MCYSAIDLIDPNIRFCAYKLQLSGGQDIDSLVSNYQGVGIQSLREKLEKIVDDMDKKGAQPLKAVTWRNKEIEVKNQVLGEAIVKAQGTKLNQDTDVKSCYGDVLSAWMDAKKIAKKAIKEDKEATAKITSSKSAKATEDLNYLFTYVNYNLFGYSIKRDVSLADEAQKNNGKPSQVTKLYDDILKVKKKKKKHFFCECWVYSLNLFYRISNTYGNSRM